MGISSRISTHHCSLDKGSCCSNTLVLSFAVMAAGSDWFVCFDMNLVIDLVTGLGMTAVMVARR